MKSQQTLSIKEAAKILKVSEKTLRRWEKKGILTPIRTSGGHRRYDPKIIQSIKSKKSRKILKKINGIFVNSNINSPQSAINQDQAVNPPIFYEKILAEKTKEVENTKEYFKKLNFPEHNFGVVSDKNSPQDFSDKQSADISSFSDSKNAKVAEKNLIDKYQLGTTYDRIPKSKHLFKLASAFIFVFLVILIAKNIYANKHIENLLTLGKNNIQSIVNLGKFQKTKKELISDHISVETKKVLAASSFSNITFQVNVDGIFTQDIYANKILHANGGIISSTSETFDLLSENVNTLSIGLAASQISIGSNQGQTIVGNSLEVRGTSNDIAGTLNLSGNILTSDNDLVINPGGGGVVIGTGTPNSIDLAGNDLLVSGDTEIKGTTFINVLSINNDVITDITGSGLTVSNGSLQTTLGNSISSGEIEDGTIKAIDFHNTNTPLNGQILSYDSSTGGFTWIAASTVSGPWTDSGNEVYLTDTTDNVVIGATTPISSSTLSIVGTSNRIQFLVRGNSVQTANIFEIENSLGNNLLTVDNNGNITLATGADLIIGSIGLNDVGSGSTTSGANLIGVYDEFDNSNSTNLQAVLNDLDAAIGSGASKFTQQTGFIYLTNTTDSVTIGGTNELAKLAIDGDTNEVQLLVQGHSIQSNFLAVFEQFDGTDVFTISNSGNLSTIGDFAINGGDLTTTATTFNLLNSGVSTINFAQSATNVNFGMAGGNFTIASNVTINGTLTTAASNFAADGATIFTPSGTNDVTFNLDADSTVIINGLLSGTPANGLCLDASNNLITCDPAITINMQDAYDNDPDGSNVIVNLNSNDDSIIFRNPLTGGTDSGYILLIDQLNTSSVDGLRISQSGTGIGLNITSSSTGTLGSFISTGAVTTADGIIIAASNAAGVITDALDVSDPEIVNAINIGANTILGTTGVIDFTNFDVSAGGNVTAVSFTVGGDTINEFAGNGLIVSSGALTINLFTPTDGLSSTVSSGSGLEVLGAGLGLLQGCADGQVLKWNESNDSWECANDTGATSAIVNVENNEVPVGVNVDTLDFSTDFLVTASPANEANISIADDVINFTEIADAMTLDASTSIASTLSGISLDLNVSPAGTATNPIAFEVTPTFGIDATDQTLIGININPDTNGNTDSGDNLYGLNIASITATTATEHAIRIGGGWDANLFFNDATTSIQIINSGAFTFEDENGNDLAVLTDSGTTGDFTLTGDLTVSGGDIIGTTTTNLLNTGTTTLNFASAATTLNIADAAITGTIDIGGVTADGTTTVNIATNGTSADTIVIGNSHASTTISLTGGDDWSITAAGAITGTLLTIDNLRLDGNTFSSTSGNITIDGAGSLNIEDATTFNANATFTRRAIMGAHAANVGLRIPTNAGVPSAVTGTSEGDIVWDSTNDAFYVYDGSGFVQIGGGAYSGWYIDGDDTDTQLIASGQTLLVAGGTNGIDTDVDASTDLITLNLDTTEIGTTTFGSGSGFTWTFDAGATDPTIAFASNQITLGAQTLVFSGTTTVTASSLATLTTASTLGVSATTLNLGGGSASTIATPSGNANLTIAPHGTGTLNLATTNTGNVVIGNSTGTFQLTSSGGLNVSTTGNLTGVSGITTSGAYTQSGTSANTFTGATTLSGGTTTSRTLAVNSGGTQNVSVINFTSPADTTGTNISQGLSIVPTIGNATGGTNTANIFNIAAVTGDAEVSLNAINIGALTGTTANEYAIN
ncbi:MAG: MerR family DNA-binding transcriptional regulator, partial [Patescibacteria group bacterium]|nr:MerR family DNA-binding transcriptional regulator [Patescibacteria group bacterium]